MSGSFLAAALLPLLMTGCLIVDYDYVEGYQPALWVSDWPPLGDSLADADILLKVWWGEIGIPADMPPEIKQLLADPLQFCTRRLDLLQKLTVEDIWTKEFDLYNKACMTMADIDSLLGTTQDLPFGTGYFALFGIWYAHGLAVPCCGEEACWSWEGELLPTPGDSALGNREDFAIYICSVLSPRVQVATTLHEIAHVLNLHHADFGFGDQCLDCYDPDTYEEVKLALGDSGRFGWASLQHLTDRSSHKAKYVRPGLLGSRWCDVGITHGSLHGTDCETQSKPTSPQLPEGVSLLVEPEKDALLPGEPILVRIVLQVDPGVARTRELQFLSEPSLDPRLGFLHLWSGSSGDPNALEPVEVPILGKDPRVRPTPLVKTVSVSGVDAGFLPAAEGPSVAGAHFVSATLSGLRQTPPAALRRAAPPQADLVVRSDPAEVGSLIDLKPLDLDPNAYALFTHPEARRFEYFMGGDHLVTGRQNLEEIARDHGASIYAPYANLALGVNLSRPFRGYDPNQRSMTFRPPDPNSAADYLEDAGERVDDLPLSYQLVLHQTRASVHEELGDSVASGRAREAVGHYEIAIGELESLLDALRRVAWPPSESERIARARADQKLPELRTKLEDLRTPPP
jgi:hypothetical protein